MKSAALVVALVGIVAACGDNYSSNGVPVIEGDQITTAEDTPVSVTVQASDPEGAAIGLTFTTPAHGTVTASGLTLTYTPTANYNGVDTLEVTATDGTLSATATITITVTAANDGPVAVDDALAANEDAVATLEVAALIANDTDPDGDTLSVSAVGNASTGTVALAGTTVSFTPPTDFTGTATFEYTLTDGSATDTGLVTVTVGGDNDAPVAVDDQVTTAEDTVATIAAATLVANDTDAEGQLLSVTAVANPTNGTVALAGGTITFTPALDFNGTATFEYTVSDGAGTDVSQVMVVVTPVNDAPIAIAGTATTNEDAPVTITLSGSDVDGSPLTFAIATAPTSGTLGAITQVTTTTASVTYTPGPNSTIDDGFTFTVNDGTATSTPAMVTIDVVPVNDAPIAVAGTAMTNEDMSVTITLAGADSENGALTFAVATPPTAGTLGAITQVTTTTASVTYTPAANSTADDSFTFQVSDGTTASAPATIAIDVVPVNDAPVAIAGTATTNEDVPVTITLSGSDIDSAALTFSVLAAATQHGTLGPITQLTPTTASITYTPAANSTTDDVISFQVNDGTLTSAAATVTIDVVPVDDPPVATAGTATVNEDDTVTITLAGTDGEGAPLTFAIVTGPAAGTLGTITQVTPTTATVVYTPAANSSADDTFTFRVNNGTSNSAPATISIDVVPVNDAPVAIAAAATTNEDVPVTITLSGSDIDSTALTFSVIAAATEHGTLGPITQLTPTTASITYTPAANSTTDDVISFQVNDGTLTSTAATVTIDVVPVDDPPVATAGTATVNEDGAVTITLAGTDGEGGALTFAIVDAPTAGTLGTITQVTPTTATVVYTPAANSSTDDTFTFRVNDGTSNSAPATISIDVVPVNDAPVAVDDTDTVERDTALVRAGAVYTTNDTDLDGPPPLTVTAVANAVNGTVALAAGTITFTPTPGFVGSASFDYEVSDAGLLSDIGHVVVTVIETNTAPIAVDDTATTAEDTNLEIGAVFTANDIDPDPQTLTIVGAQNPVNGTIQVIGGVPFFVPTANYSGPASFEYLVSDGLVEDVGLVSITVTPVNDLPIAANDATTLDEDAAATTVDVLGNDSDVEGAVTVTAVTQPASGTVTLVTGVVSYQPTANFHGTDTFTYTVEDSSLATATATVTVTVSPVNDLPIVQAQTQSVPENAPATLTLSATDVDLPAQTLTFAVGTGPDHGTLGAIVPTSPTTATVTYTPTTDYVGSDAFTITATDGVGTSALATIAINVTNVAACGDGVIEGSEACDDQGTAPGDGCSAACQVETGWSCTGTPSACDPICNDGTVIAGNEACDDGNPVDTDGCTTQCQVGVICAASNASLAAGDHFATDPATGTCYVSFDDEQTTFAAAQTACIAAGGHLASITSAGEQTLVASIQNTAQDPWIGGTDELVEGSFGWLTGEAFGYTSFATNQPDGGDPEDCLALVSTVVSATDVGRWNDTNCAFVGFTAGRICELAADACGDTFVQSSRGETCDDGNATAGDGCSATCQVEAPAATPFFSEYIEGSSNNKAVEIANLGSVPLDLTGCSLRLYSNGSATPSVTLALTQTIAANDVFVACHTMLNSAFLPQCDLSSTTVNNVLAFNGDDGVELFCNGATVDMIGQRGNDPGNEWGSALTSTADNTLRRKCAITAGDTINNDVFNPATEWGGFATDTFTGLGTYNCVP